MCRIGVRIISNNVFLANDIRHAKSIEVTLLGGFFRQQSQVNVGPLVSLCAASLEADAIFMGADGWDPVLGPMCSDLYEAEALRTMARRTSKRVLLVDSSKFRRRCVVPLGVELDGVTIVTDADVPKEARVTLRELDARVVVC